jgi:hypothetical protein
LHRIKYLPYFLGFSISITTFPRLLPFHNANEECIDKDAEEKFTAFLKVQTKSANSFREYPVFGQRFESDHVWWVPCHRGMARPQVADGGDALQVWRVAANILNKQSRTADKGWSSSLVVGRGANNSSP